MALLFNSESARAASAKSAEARRQFRREHTQTLALCKALASKLAAIESAAPTAYPAQPTISQSDRLARVRKQLRAIDDKIDAELARTDCHPKAVEALARAAQVLAEQERVLDGRPLPGTLRPKGSGPAGAGHAPNRTPPTVE